MIFIFQVILVKWNEPYQKLASCDSTGIIFVWIKYEGRWSIELINDRNCPVTHFSWSHDGRMALICYQVNMKIWTHFCYIYKNVNFRKGWIRTCWIRIRPKVLVVNAKSGVNDNLWYLDT